jgi:hypothetical protein
MTQPIPMIRMAYVDVAGSGRSCTLRTPEGLIVMDRVDPHGVQIMAGDQVFRVSAEALPFVGRFFLAAAHLLGRDLNEGWDGLQEGGRTVAGG